MSNRHYKFSGPIPFLKSPLGQTLAQAACLLASMGSVLAAPTGGQVVQGTATIQQNGALTTIQAGNKSIINYSSFNIGPQETVRFIQPSATSTVLNRVVGVNNPSQILGQLQANGQVFLVNPAGIFFGKNSVVDAGQIYAAAGAISNQDFNAGVNHFTNVQGAVVNDGLINAQGVALVGSHVRNTGTITAPQGFIVLASGDDILIGTDGFDSSLYVKVASTSPAPAAGTASGVENSGTVSAPGGQAMLVAGDLYSLALDKNSLIQASSVKIAGGNGVPVLVSGAVDASSTAPGQTGGTIQITGNQVGLMAGANLDASGPAGGGTINVGGGAHGADSAIPNASETYVSPSATITADATSNGNGGNVVVWSNDLTQFGGTLSAQGGPLGGNGGFAEVSGKQNLDFQPLAINLSSTRGSLGRLLLDPANITVLTIGSATATVTDVNAFTTNAGTDQIIKPATLDAAAADILLQATDTITIDSPVNLHTAGAKFTAQAGNLINVYSSITTNGGAISLSAADPASGAANDDGGVYLVGDLDAGSGSITLDAHAGSFGISFDATTSLSALGGVTIKTGAGFNFDLTINGPAEFDGEIVGEGNLHVTGPTLINTDLVSTHGTEIYDGLVTLGMDTTFNVDLAITLPAVTGAYNLTVNSQSAISISAPFTSNVTGLSLVAGDDITTTATVNVPDAQLSFYTSANIAVGGPVTALSINMTTTQPGTRITIPAGNDLTTTNGEVNLFGISISLGANITAASPDFSNITTILFDGPVTLTAPVMLTSNSEIEFDSQATVDGAYTLTGDGYVQFVRDVGGITPLTSINVTGGTNADGSNPTLTITTTGTQTYSGGLTVSTSLLTTLDTTGGGLNPAGANITLGPILGEGEQSYPLAINSGTAGIISGTSVDYITELTIINSNQTTFTGDVGRIAPGIVTLQDTAAGNAIAFQGNTHIVTLNTANQPYNVSITGDTDRVETATAFLNTGTVTLGTDGGTFIFNNGVTTAGSASNPSSTIVSGSVFTDGAAITFGPTIVFADTTLDPTNLNDSPAGAAITTGAVTGSETPSALTLNAGTGGQISTLGISGVTTLTVNTGSTVLIDGDVSASNDVLMGTVSTLLIPTRATIDGGIGSGGQINLNTQQFLNVTGSASAVNDLSLNSAGIPTSLAQVVSLPTAGTRGLLLGGTAYVSTGGGDVKLNAGYNDVTDSIGTTPNGFVSVIMQNEEGVTLGGSSTANVIFGRGQYVSAAPSAPTTATPNDLTITSTDSIVLSDLNVFGTLALNTPAVTLLTHDPLQIPTGPSNHLAPLNVVANGITGTVDPAAIVPSGSSTDYRFGVPTLADNQIGGATADNTREYNSGAQVLDSNFFTDTKVIFLTVLDPGSQTTNLAPVIVGAIPPHPVFTLPLAPLDTNSISSSNLLGLYTTPATSSEKFETLNTATIFDDIARTDSPRGSDFKVSALRISGDAAADVLDAYNQLFFAGGDPTKEPQLPKIQAAFNDSYQTYAATTGSATPAGYQAYLESNAATNPSAAAALNFLKQFKDLFHKIDNMGLANTEEEAPKNDLLRGVGPSPAFMKELIGLSPPQGASSKLVSDR